MYPRYEKKVENLANVPEYSWRKIDESDAFFCKKGEPETRGLFIISAGFDYVINTSHENDSSLFLELFSPNSNSISITEQKFFKNFQIFVLKKITATLEYTIYHILTKNCGFGKIPKTKFWRFLKFFWTQIKMFDSKNFQ